jgi:hypothetical protein
VELVAPMFFILAASFGVYFLLSITTQCLRKAVVYIAQDVSRGSAIISHFLKCSEPEATVTVELVAPMFFILAASFEVYFLVSLRHHAYEKLLFISLKMYPGAVLLFHTY